MNKRNDHQLKKLLIVELILLVSTLEIVWGIVRRICIPILGCKGLKKGGKSIFHEYAEDEEHKSTQDVVKPVLSSHP